MNWVNCYTPASNKWHCPSNYVNIMKNVCNLTAFGRGLGFYHFLKSVYLSPEHRQKLKQETRAPLSSIYSVKDKALVYDLLTCFFFFCHECWRLYRFWMCSLSVGFQTRFVFFLGDFHAGLFTHTGAMYFVLLEVAPQSCRCPCSLLLHNAKLWNFCL